MLIINNTSRLITLRPKGQKETLSLAPGNNQVKDDVYRSLLEDKKDSFRDRVDIGDFKIVTDENGNVAVAEGGGVNLSTLNAPDAIQVIENSTEIEELEDLEKQETTGKARKVILDAAKRHKEKLQSVIAKEKSVE